MPDASEPSADLGQPRIKVEVGSVHVARVMVDAFGLAAIADDPKGILNGMLNGLAALVHHDASAVYVVDRGRTRLRHTMVRGCDMPVPDLTEPFAGNGVVGDVLASGAPINIPEGSGETSGGRPGARSRLVVPITGAMGQVLGALDLWSDQPGGYDTDAIALVELFGRAVAGAIEGARLQAEVVDKRRLDVDMALARQVMGDLLPHGTPTIAGYDIAAIHESPLAVGGDYYEFMRLDDDRWGVVVADVVGKGIAAALLVSAIRASIRSLAGHELALRAVMRRANRFFHDSVEEGRYVTLFYAVFDPLRRRLIYVNAGHVPPILRRSTGAVELLEEGGVPLGLFEAPRYFEGYVRLNKGDILTLYTDGIVETADPDDNFYDMDRFVEQITSHAASSATEICGQIMQDVRRFGKGAVQDDRTLVVMKVRA